MNFKKYLIIILASVTFYNCSSTYYSLKPDEDSRVNQGREIIEKEKDDILTTLILEDKNSNSYIFYLHVENQSQENILVDPGEIYMKSYNKNKELMKIQNIYAVNPEQKIAQIDNAIDDREDEHDVSTGFNFAFSLLSTIINLSDDNNDNKAEDVVDNVITFADNQVNEEISYSNDIDYLSSEKQYWKNNVLRTTELYKGESVEGIFYIPINEFAEFIKIVIPLGNSTHSFKFKQIKTIR